MARKPVTFEKCPCGHRGCDQYILSTQRSAGFSLEDATLYAAADDLLQALELILSPSPHYAATQEHRDLIKKARENGLSAIAKARGEG